MGKLVALNNLQSGYQKSGRNLACGSIPKEIFQMILKKYCDCVKTCTRKKKCITEVFIYCDLKDSCLFQ